MHHVSKFMVRVSAVGHFGEVGLAREHLVQIHSHHVQSPEQSPV